MLAVKAVVKDGMIKPLEVIDLPEDKEIVVYISEEKEEEEYSDWTEEEYRMQAIRDLIDTEKLKHIMNIPETFGDKVEVIVLPFNKDEKSESYYLMKMQQHSGYIQALLNDPDDIDSLNWELFMQGKQ